MPDLPRIPALDTVTVPPEPEKVYNDLFIYQMKLITGDDMSQAITVRLKYYNYDTKELDPSDNVVGFTIQNLVEEAARVPAMAQTMGAFVVVSGLMYQEQELTRRIALLQSEGEDTSVLETQLQGVQTALGVV